MTLYIHCQSVLYNRLIDLIYDLLSSSQQMPFFPTGGHTSKIQHNIANYIAIYTVCTLTITKFIANYVYNVHTTQITQ